MEVIKFTLSGRNAFFKKPEVNTFYYFTYGCIHKVALIGIFGAILGYSGYNQREKGELIPEFYKKLEGIEVSIVPRNPNGFISKKIQVFNNSVGYASQEQGGNLVVKEQWLENPIWDIYFMINSEETTELANRLINGTCVYVPYLGKNDHFADITNVQRISTVESCNQDIIISSLLRKQKAKFAIRKSEDFFWGDEELEETYKYEEKLPYSLSKDTSLYELESMVFTNVKLESYDDIVYEVEGKKIVFI